MSTGSAPENGTHGGSWMNICLKCEAEQTPTTEESDELELRVVGTPTWEAGTSDSEWPFFRGDSDKRTQQEITTLKEDINIKRLQIELEEAKMALQDIKTSSTLGPVMGWEKAECIEKIQRLTEELDRCSRARSRLASELNSCGKFKDGEDKNFLLVDHDIDLKNIHPPSPTECASIRFSNAGAATPSLHIANVALHPGTVGEEEGKNKYYAQSTSANHEGIENEIYRASSESSTSTDRAIASIFEPMCSTSSKSSESYFTRKCTFSS